MCACRISSNRAILYYQYRVNLGDPSHFCAKFTLQHCHGKTGNGRMICNIKNSQVLPVSNKRDIKIK